jgi:NAD(P)-dependent dehydrogenase (short-subunit alcohol dehydrogenase family)
MVGIDLKGRVAIITGGLGDIGRAVAKTLRCAGALVVSWDISKDADLDNVDQASFSVDVTDESSVSVAMNATRARFERVDILVNGVGLLGREDLLESLSLAEWTRVVNVNLASVFLCSRAVIPLMRDRGYGRIVNIASNAGKDCNPYQSAYSAAKAGVIGLTKSLGRELAQTGILVNCVTPALVDTQMAQSLTRPTRESALRKIPMGRMGRPDEVANLIAWLASDQCSFSTGAVYDLSGGRASY